MIIQYYQREKQIRGFNEKGVVDLMIFEANEITPEKRQMIGLPPLRKWTRADFGYEIVGDFKFKPRLAKRESK